MPNWVQTTVRITIPKSSKDSAEFIRDLVTSKTSEGEYHIDFEKITPSPKTIEECPSYAIIEKDEHPHIQILEDRPWFNWYSWNNINYGTKWKPREDSSYCSIRLNANGSSTLYFAFETAWSYPEPIIKKMLSSLGYNASIKYADEDLGSNCGHIKYDAKNDEFTYLDIANPHRFANDVWCNA